MADTLRTRIAKVLYSSFATELRGDYALGWKNESDYVKADYLDAADAVIRELGLTVEWDGDNPYDPGPRWRHRYVTEWTADE